MSETDKENQDKNDPIQISKSTSIEEGSFIEILQNAEFGRYLVAGQDIEELSLILNESPVTFGPGDDDHDIDQGEVPMCLGCCARLSLYNNNNNNMSQRCSHCGWPVCGENCPNLEIHAQNECILFRDGGVPYPPPHTWPIINKSVLTLRCLLLKGRDKDGWENGIGTLEHHTQVRKQKSYCVKADEMLMENVEYFLGVQNDEEDNELRGEIIKISGIINVNAFSTTNNSSTGMMIAQCIYPTASLFANSCVPNCTWRISAESFQIWVRSAVPIKKGEIISISYSPHDTLSGTLQRQISNEDVAHFTCSCVRCKDPTEFNSFISAVKCPTCYDDDLENDHDISNLNEDEGYLLPLNPLLPDSPWICNSKGCDESATVHKIFAKTYRIQQMFDAIKGAGFERFEEIEELEQVLEIGAKILHSNHYMMQDIRMHIVKRQIPALDYLEEEQLQNLIQHTKTLLNVANILAPGFSQIRALLQHFLAQELRAQLWQLKNGSIENDETDDTTEDEKCREKKECDMMKFVEYLETRALLFFQCHNYQAENEGIIKNIKNSLKIE